ncbi:acyltransferase family protein [Bradyrhizobium septentrionale]|uniref:Acyltransferase n=1 Tax=Bradyrhizobium septentrionale TaxID=1404411 RepID=A0A973W0U7_9BRAD|nr:acyltransferase [Bradyrhizobium septentrionale]UGY13959.1 acyltransferase [Bradyrhizobium septentrionale]UGY22513.1 acyltransferase [Bradyrhizobium septentrionale]
MPDVQEQPGPTRVPILDLLRLAAVGAVILYHYGFWGPASHGVQQVAMPYLAPVAQYGFLGVPVFFAISGFVIAYSAEGRTPVGFAIARFSRIYPTFVICMTLTFLATLLVGHAWFHVTWGQWLANLFIAAPMFGQPYMDDAYWSLVIEVVFYVWVALFLAWGIFPRRIDTIIVAWIAITFVNELTLDIPLFEKLFMADDSGFFAVGLLIYEHYRGRRDTRLYSLLTLAMGTATFQAVHKLERLGVHTHGSFDPMVVTAISIVSLGIVFAATRIKSVPLPASLVSAVGGITYPLYLLHLQLGYVILLAMTPTPDALSTALVVTAVVVLAWFVWRFLEAPAHGLVRDKLTLLASRHGWPTRLRAGEPRIKSGRISGRVEAEQIANR